MKFQELIRLKEELEEEREKLIRTTKKLKDDLQNVKSELKLTNEMKKTLEQEKISLNSKTEYLQANMEVNLGFFITINVIVLQLKIMIM